MPIPGPTQERKLGRRLYLSSGHTVDDGTIYWDLDHPRLWRNACRDFEREVIGTAGGRLGVPADFEQQLGALNAGVKLARAALSIASPAERALVWEWFHPLTDEHGFTELLDHGMLHADKLRFAAQWDQHERYVREHLHFFAPPELKTFVDSQLVSVLYESTVMCGLVFLDGLADLVKTGRSGLREKLWGSNARVPYLDKAAERASAAMGGRWSRSRAFTASDRKTLARFAESMNQRHAAKSPPGSASDLRWIRDSLAHGKFEIGADGAIFLDVYEHRLVRMQSSRRRGSAHPYLYPSLKPRGAREMRLLAQSYAVVFWAIYKECERLLWRDVTHRSPPVEPRALAAARRAIRRTRVKIGDKTSAKELAAAKRREARSRVKVTAVRVIPTK